MVLHSPPVPPLHHSSHSEMYGGTARSSLRVVAVEEGEEEVEEEGKRKVEEREMVEEEGEGEKNKGDFCRASCTI